MMEVNVMAFGVAKDIVGGSSIALQLADDMAVADLKRLLEGQFPKLKQLKNYMLALNKAYAADGDTIHERDEIAIIPPVSGG